jgi:hypothetical protein
MRKVNAKIFVVGIHPKPDGGFSNMWKRTDHLNKNSCPSRAAAAYAAAPALLTTCCAVFPIISMTSSKCCGWLVSGCGSQHVPFLVKYGSKQKLQT